MSKFLDHLKRAGETQSKFASRLGISQGHLSEIARGLKEPSGRLAYLIEIETGGAIPMAYWFDDLSPSHQHRKEPDNA